jgi:hypothetical protein
MRLPKIGLGLALLVGLAALTQAAPLDLKNVPADAKWLVHVDVDAIRASTVAKQVWHKGLEMHKDAEKHLAQLHDRLGLDIRHDLHGVTLYGKKFVEHTGVAIVNAKMDQKLLLDKAAKAPDHKVTKFGSYDLHSWTAKHHGHTRTVWGAFYKPDWLVFASSEGELKAALERLDGNGPELDKHSPLAGRVRPGATFLARAVGLAESDLPTRCVVAKQVESARVSMGEHEGESFFYAKIVFNSAETADQVRAVVEGFKALAGLHTGDDPQAKKLVDALHVTLRDRTLRLHWTAAAGDVWQQIEKHAKWMAEHHGKTGWPWPQKPDGKKAPQEKPKDKPAEKP